MEILTRLVRRPGIDIPVNTPEPMSEGSIQTLERLLEVERRVESRFGITAESGHVEGLIAAAKTRGEVITALQQLRFGVLDSKAVREYQTIRTQKNISERFKEGFVRIWRAWWNMTMHGKLGKISAWVAFLVTAPLTLYLLARHFGTDVPFRKWYQVQLTLQSLPCCLVFVFCKPGTEEGVYRYFGKAYAILNVAVLSLLTFVAALIAPVFMSVSSGRTWKTISVKEFLGTTTPDMELVLTMDTVGEALPNAPLQFEALVRQDGTYDGEAFLVIPDGFTPDPLRVWHGRAW